jgi:hypothetical protein
MPVRKDLFRVSGLRNSEPQGKKRKAGGLGASFGFAWEGRNGQLVAKVPAPPDGPCAGADGRSRPRTRQPPAKPRR